MSLKYRKKEISSAPVYRNATFQTASINEEERTIDLCWTTGARVLRVPWFDDPYFEELAVDSSAVRMERLNSFAPLLDSHLSESLANQLGSVERAWIKGNEGWATVRFRSNRASLEIWEDVKAGIIRNVSVGYMIHEMMEERASDAKYSTFRAIDWEPFEISMVPVPADSGAQVRSNSPKYPTLVRSLPMEVEEENVDTTQNVQTRSNEPAASPPKEERSTPKPEPKPDLEKLKREAIESERKRSSDIENLCAKANLPDMARSLIDSGVGIEEARSQVFEKMIEREPETTSHTRVEMGEQNETDTRREAIKGALLHRYAPTKFKLEGASKDYRGMSLSEMVRTSLGREGRGLSKRELATRAFHSTSDFPEILANVARQSLLDGYERMIQRQTFQPLVRIVEATDFKPMKKVRLGEIPSLKHVPEGGEITSGTLGESHEIYSIATYARKFGLTRETIINDDLDAFTDMPSKWGIAAARLENILFWSIFTQNQALSDGQPLFSEAHGNVAKIGGEIGEAALSAAELAMSQQTGIDKRDKLNIVPSYLIVPTTLKTKAKKAIMMPIVPNKTQDTNPFAGEYQIISEPLLNDASAKAWFMAADTDQGIDLVEMAYLDGIREPQVEFRDSFDTFGVELRAYLDVGAKALDYRGLYKNEGK